MRVFSAPGQNIIFAVIESKEFYCRHSERNDAEDGWISSRSRSDLITNFYAATVNSELNLVSAVCDFAKFNGAVR